MSHAFTIPGAVEFTGKTLSRSALYVAMKEGRLTARKCGRRTLILREELERFLQSLPAAY